MNTLITSWHVAYKLAVVLPLLALAATSLIYLGERIAISAVRTFQARRVLHQIRLGSLVLALCALGFVGYELLDEIETITTRGLLVASVIGLAAIAMLHYVHRKTRVNADSLGAGMLFVVNGAHAFIDGLLIGTANFFTSFGGHLAASSTSAAVYSHELPKLFAFALILYAARHSYAKAVMITCLSQGMAIIGVFAVLEYRTFLHHHTEWLGLVGYMSMLVVAGYLLYELFTHGKHSHGAHHH